MKKLILLELAFLFLATTFSANPPPPGWYQQTLPVNDFVNDIFFLDSLNGWVVTPNGYIMNTQNGGNNWTIQKDSAGNLYSVQFLDNQTGYVLGNGNHGIIYKTINAGSNWNLIHDFNPAGIFRDMSFVNNDTGWVCSIDAFDGGVFKTTNGGMNWQRQLNYGVYNPQVVFFINKDTGWIGNDNNRLYKTINGGQNWDLEIIFPGTGPQINDIYFFNGSTGFVSSGRIYKTTNGGISWDTANEGGFKFSFSNDSLGWLGSEFHKIKKTTSGGLNWFIQYSPIFNNSNINTVDNLIAWAGGSGIVHTTDGGPTSININNDEILSAFVLFQNYPNPFNPFTNLSYELQFESNVRLEIFDIQGRIVKSIPDKKQSPGHYNINFDGSNLPGGVYFYKLEVIKNNPGQIFSETKKMLLIK